MALNPTAQSHGIVEDPHTYDYQTAENGLDIKGPIVVEQAEQEDETARETRQANRIHWGEATVDIFIALLPLYFVAFTVAAFVRDGTLGNSVRNNAIFQMAKLNPTIFPILFTLIFAKFIKAIATWKLERGATVGQIQHLLGSRSLVAAVFTPLKLRTISFLVPLLVMVWGMNPLGGQLSLRVVTKESNLTAIDTPFLYINPNSSWNREQSDPTIDIGFNMALLSPAASKNGTQDMFGSIHIPMLEHLQKDQTADEDGWYYTQDPKLEGWQAAVNHAFDLLKERPKPVYSALLGIPFKANFTSPHVTRNTSTISIGDFDLNLAEIKHDLWGGDVKSTRQKFTIESSYMYTNCTFEPLIVDGVVSSDNYTSIRGTKFDNATGEVVSNDLGFFISYDPAHNYTSTAPRRIGVSSWITTPNTQEWVDRFGNSRSTISEAWCELTTRHVEAQVFCVTETNCTVAMLRESKRPNPSPALSALDGITFPQQYLDQPDGRETFNMYAEYAARRFFNGFAKSTGKTDPYMNNLSPLESYFWRPDIPYRASFSGAGAGGGSDQQEPIVGVGNELFSTRLSQLLNTYWLMQSDPTFMVGGIDLDVIADGSSAIGEYPTSIGQTHIEKLVLRCHRPFAILLLVISLGLFGLGLATAYLDATRKGPDVLDNFVNSLRHNPYVHVEKLGPSMEDGLDMAKRLKNTVVQIGDVQPDSRIGYVAIGTPNDRQPVERLDHRRQYY